ncbi:MAG: hypothetical protein AAB019_12375, partial [Planctomycetota bacterium]
DIITLSFIEYTYCLKGSGTLFSGNISRTSSTVEHSDDVSILMSSYSIKSADGVLKVNKLLVSVVSGDTY